MKAIFAIAVVSLFVFGSTKSVEKIDREGICNMCVELITKAGIEIIEHEDDFRKNGGKICDVITIGNDDLDAKCKEFVKDKVDDIIQLIKESKSPKDICTTFKFCPSSSF